MLYDPKWNDPVYNGVRLSEFAAWLATKPADEQYEYTDAFDCALGQFNKARGLTGFDVAISGSELNNYAKWLHNIVSHYPHTFGGALARAKEIQRELVQ